MVEKPPVLLLPVPIKLSCRAGADLGVGALVELLVPARNKKDSACAQAGSAKIPKPKKSAATKKILQGKCFSDNIGILLYFPKIYGK